MALFTSRFDALEKGQQGALSDFALLLDDMHSSIKTIEVQTAEIKAISVNQMHVLTQLFSGESDIPRLYILYKKEHSRSFFGAVNKATYSVKTMGGTKYKLIIICECCMAPGPTGPKKNGFSTSVPSAALVSMAPALLLGLKLFVVAVGVTGGVTGVKLPLPSFASIDALQATLDHMQELAGPVIAESVSACAESAFQVEATTNCLSPNQMRSLAAASSRIQEATHDSYKSLKALLHSCDPNAKFYGETDSPTISTPFVLLLLFEHSVVGVSQCEGGDKEKGTWASKWVCASCRPAFQKLGREFVPGTK